MFPMIAMGLYITILMCGFGLDIARIEMAKTQVQTAADAAAIGAELEFERNTYVNNNGTWGYTQGGYFKAGGTNTWLAAGQGDAGLNGITNGVNNATVTVQQGPTTGAYSGRMDALQATVTYPVQTMFMGALSGGTYTLTATAVSLVPPCVLAMNTTSQTSSFSLTNTNDNSYCPIYVNQGLNIDSASYIYSTELEVVGNNVVNHGRSVPSPTTNEPAITDPLAGITAPTFVSCSTGHTSTMTVNGGGGYAGQGYGGLNLEPVNVTPGTYCGGFNLTSAQLNMAPGLYIVTGGMTISNSILINSPQVTSSAPNTAGVTIYFTQGGGYGYGTVTVGGNSSILLDAPTLATGGDYAGILFFFDRNWTPANGNSLVCNDAYFIGNGIWYSAHSGMSFNTCSNTTDTYFGLVANTLTFSGNVYGSSLGFSPASNFSNLSYGNPFRSKGVLVQ